MSNFELPNLLIEAEDFSDYGGWVLDSQFETVLHDSTIDAIIVTTPTETHFDMCKAALDAGKHVFVEKPLANSMDKIEKLYTCAERNKRLLFVGYNRRYDPEWRRLVDQVGTGSPYAIDIICRDYPFPPASYLKTCGGIFRDAAVHDIDMMCLLLNDTPVVVDAMLDCVEENASVFMQFSKGCRAHMVHSRHAPSYEQSVHIVLRDKTVHMCPDPRECGTTFQTRYRESYVQQLADFAKRLSEGRFAPNVSFEEATSMERILDACDTSAIKGEPVQLHTLREYEAAKERVRLLYKDARTHNTPREREKER